MDRRLLRILVLTNDFPPRIGGIEEYVAEFVGRLPKSFSVTVLTSQHTHSFAFDRSFPFRVIRWAPYPLLPTPGFARSVREMIVREHIDVLLFGATLPLAAIAASIRRHTGVPIIMCTHGLEPAVASVSGGAVLLRRILRHATTVTVISQWSRALIESCVAAGTRVVQLPAGVEPDRFVLVDGSPVREKYKLGSGPVIVTVGRLVARKGQDSLIRALPRIAEAFPNVRLLLVGSGPDRSRLERLAQRRGVMKRVVFAGRVSESELPGCFACADVFAMPCRSRCGGLDVEGLGTVFLQAAASGLPAIAGRSGGAPEAVIDQQTGLVISGGDATSVEQALLRLLEQPRVARALGEAARLRVCREYDWKILSERFKVALLEAAGTSRAVRSE